MATPFSMEELLVFDGAAAFFEGEWPEYEHANVLVDTLTSPEVSSEYGEQHHDQLGECFAAKMSVPSLVQARNAIEGAGGRQALYGIYFALPTLLKVVNLTLSQPLPHDIYDSFELALLMHVLVVWELGPDHIDPHVN